MCTGFAKKLKCLQIWVTHDVFVFSILILASIHLAFALLLPLHPPQLWGKFNLNDLQLLTKVWTLSTVVAEESVF